MKILLPCGQGTGGLYSGAIAGTLPPIAAGGGRAVPAPG